MDKGFVNPFFACPESLVHQMRENDTDWGYDDVQLDSAVSEPSVRNGPRDREKRRTSHDWNYDIHFHH